jgi:tetratricopeptide (TPR) repeat protein
VLAFATAGFVLPSSRADVPVDAETYARAGQIHFYNSEYDEATADYQRALALAPDCPRYRNYLATNHLYKQLYLSGQLDANLYSASNEFAKAQPVQTNAELIQAFLAELKQAREIAQQLLAKNPSDVEALYALASNHAIEANYNFSVTRKLLAALGNGKEAKKYAERVKRLDPNFADVDVILGVYEYAIGSIPAYLRWLSFLMGLHGDKQTGIRLLQNSMTKGKYSSTDAAVLLAVIYYREKQYPYTREILERLQNFYPRNHILPMQIAQTYKRERRTDKVLEIYLDIARKAENQAPGFDRAPLDKVFYEIAAVYDKQGDTEAALAYYAKVAQWDRAEEIVRAHSLLRRGEIYERQRQAAKAREMYEAAAKLNVPEVQRLAHEHLKNLK